MLVAHDGWSKMRVPFLGHVLLNVGPPLKRGPTRGPCSGQPTDAQDRMLSSSEPRGVTSARPLWPKKCGNDGH